ncbi:AbgT family transporter [Corynebacterium sp.]|uniref:AbgT family transporter n=1 Tax=Corynebacterium sp. TaxID=1720 RepID=UPI0027BA7CCA|nr:AbgT family transporter [Corynebacterium sp.]
MTAQAPSPPGGDTIQGNRVINFAFQCINKIEVWGNKLPHPFWLFVVLSGVLVGLSAIFESIGLSATKPDDGTEVAVKSLLSREGMTVIVGDVVENFASFPPLATILTTMLGIVIAEKSGLFDTVLKLTVTKVPPRFTTFALCYAGMIGHVAGDAAYVTLIPLGAIVFRAIGRSPILGAIIAFVSISAGYDASPSLTTTDILLSTISTAAAHTIDPNAFVTPTSNYFFGLASSVLVALVITLVVELFLAKRPDLQVDEDYTDGDNDLSIADVSHKELRALKIAGLIALLFAIALVVSLSFESSPLRGEGNGILNSPVMTGMAGIIGLFFALVGLAYGLVSGSYKSVGEVLPAMIDGFRSMAPILVLFFAISQFLAYFKWTGIGQVMAISGATWFKEVNAPGWAILLGIAILISVMNLVLTSGSAMWALAAPVFIPMLMLLGVDPETTQAMYRVADSVTNCVTPMSPYFVMALGFIQQYRKSAGIGTLASFTLPLAGVVWVVWISFFLLWYLLGLPFGF